MATLLLFRKPDPKILALSITKTANHPRNLPYPRDI
jgi:hypothetical protein